MPTNHTNDEYQYLSRSLTALNQQESLGLRERALADRETLGQQHAAIQAQEFELRKVQQLAALQKQEQRIRDTMEKQRQIMHATKALGDISPDDPNWERTLAQTIHDNPLAESDEFVKKKVGFLYDHTKAKEAAANKMSEMAEAFASKNGVDVKWTDGGTPDWKAMDQAAADTKSGRQWTNAQLVPKGLESSKMKVTAKGDVEQEFERPKSGPGSSQPDTLAKFSNDIKGIVPTTGFFEDPTSWKPGADKKTVSKTWKDDAGKDQTTTLHADHYKQLQDRYNALLSPPAAQLPSADPQVSAAKAWLSANPNNPQAAAVKAKLGME